MKVLRVFVTAVLSTLVVPQFVKGGDDSAGARDAMFARLKRLQSLQVDYRECLTSNPTDKARLLVKTLNDKYRGTRVYSIPSKPIGYDCRFCFLSGKARYDRQVARGYEDAAQQPGIVDSNLVMETFTAERSELLRVSVAKKGTTGGVIDERSARQLPDTAVDAAIGLRLWDNPVWYSKADIDTASLTNDPVRPGAIILAFADAKGRTQEVRADKSLGYAITGIRIFKKANSGSCVEIECTDFKNIAGVMLPFSISCRTLSMFASNAKEPVETQRSSLAISHYELDDIENSGETYFVKWPLNTVVFDNRTHETISIRTKPRTLHDDDLAALLNEQMSKRQQQMREAQELIDRAKPSTQSAEHSK